ncbi:MAG: hypothetical protein ABI718_13495 [Acidobacteriota bacterium]
MNSNAHNHTSERGVSLVEMLIAITIMIVIIVAALLIYDSSNKVFKKSSESADMQQNTRVAYEKIVADVRMAGFDYKRGGRVSATGAAAWAPTRAYISGTIVTPISPNGHNYRATNGGTSNATAPTWPTGSGATVAEGGASTVVWQETGSVVYEQPDEQIELAGTSALTIRGNFDYDAGETGDVDHGREPNLESASFPVVTTGNSEIVTYALRSNDNTKNTDSLTFYADVNASGSPTRRAFPGGAAERLITIPTVDLTNVNPPYTLYRFTLADNGSIVSTPLADNIRSLNFDYFEDGAATKALTDLAGAAAPNVGGGGQYNPATPSATINERIIRSKIRAVRVRLVGMNPQPDGSFVDAADTAATNYRKFAVESVVVPRNLGKVGIPETEGDPPEPPTITSVYYGYCGIAVINWSTGTGTTAATYAILYDTSPTGSFANALSAGFATTYAVNLTSATNLDAHFYFRVRATNTVGSTLSTNTIDVDLKNVTKPSPPTTVVASGGGGGAPAAVANQVALTWTTPGTNASGAPAATPSGVATPLNFPTEIAGFRIYRGLTSNFTAAVGNMVVDESTATNRPIGDGVGNFIWTDLNAANCKNYYYRVQTVEFCAADANFNNPADVNQSISVESPVSASAGILGQATSAIAPQAPTSLTVDGVTSVCNGGTNLCTINMNWRKTVLDTASNPIVVDIYNVYRQQKKNGVAVGGVTLIGTVNNADVIPGVAVPYSDSTATYKDLGDGIQYTYEYTVKASQCSIESAASAKADFPVPCSFTGSIIIETGATAGDGLTSGTAWVMNGGDGIEVQPPSLGALTAVTVDVYAGSTLIATSTDTTSPFQFPWIDRVDGTVYRLVFTIADNASPACIEQLERYVQDEVAPNCTLSVDNPDGSIFTNSGYVFTLNMTNSATEALNLDAIRVTWMKPNRVGWRKTTGADTNQVTLNGKDFTPFTGATSGTAVINLSTPPAGLNTTDTSVPASGTRTALFNFVKTANGSGSTIGLGSITSICVQYKRVSTGSFQYNCRILDSSGTDASTNNPTSCN